MGRIGPEGLQWWSDLAYPEVRENGEIIEAIEVPSSEDELEQASNTSRAIGLAESLATAPDNLRPEGVREIGRELVKLLSVERLSLGSLPEGKGE